MKPSLQQEDILKKYLRETLLYRETYEEVYDHVLVAIEMMPQEISFQEAVDQILKNEFGGAKGLVEMERKCYQSVSAETLSQVFNYFKSSFKFPNLIYSIILFLIVYFFVYNFTIASFIVVFLVFVGILIPGFSMLIRHYFIGYRTQDTKKSIKDKIMGQIAGKISSFLTLILLFLSNKKNFNIDLWIVDYRTVFVLAITAFILFVFSFVRLCFDEFESYLQKSL